VVSFRIRPLYPKGKIPSYPLERRLGGPQNCSGRSGEEKNSQHRRETNPRTPVVQPIVRVINSRMKWAECEARLGEMRNAYEILVGKPKGQRPLDIDRKKIFEWVLRE
jgi:hypothetical protein